MDEPTKRSRKKSKRRPRPGSLGTETALAEEVFRLLKEIYDVIESKRRDECEPDAVGEALMIPFDPERESSAFARHLIDTFQAHLTGPQDPPPYLDGRLYCFNCESATCEHSRPPNQLSVFAGYQPTGYPEWAELYSVLLERRDARIDDLIADPPGIVALYQGPNELKEEQLGVFGRESALYDILGQVVAGYLPLPRGKGRMRTALTIQAVRAFDGRSTRLRLNLIGGVVDSSPQRGVAHGKTWTDLVDLLRLEPDPELEGHLSRARRKLDEVGRKSRVSGRSGAADSRRKPGMKREERITAVRSILNRLARGIEAMDRRQRRRTRHAMIRRTERPAVGLALKDLEHAAPERLLFDELEATFVVIGQKWRTHVFGRDGRHVTSLVLDREGFQKRLDTRRWRYATREESEQLRRTAAALNPRRNEGRE